MPSNSGGGRGGSQRRQWRALPPTKNGCGTHHVVHFVKVPLPVLPAATLRLRCLLCCGASGRCCCCCAAAGVRAVAVAAAGCFVGAVARVGRLQQRALQPPLFALPQAAAGPRTAAAAARTPAAAGLASTARQAAVGCGGARYAVRRRTPDGQRPGVHSGLQADAHRPQRLAAQHGWRKARFSCRAPARRRWRWWQRQRRQVGGWAVGGPERQRAIRSCFATILKERATRTGAP